MDMDDADRRIVRELQRDGRQSNVELARRVNLSESACLRRTRALEEGGVITGYQAVVNPDAVGLGVSAYVLVNLDQRTETDARTFFDAVEREPRIVECVAITGANDLILKVVGRDIPDIADLTMSGILRHPSVRDIASCVVLRQIKRDGGVPIHV